MMKRFWYGLLLAALLSACSSNTPPPVVSTTTVPVSVTAAPTNTSVPTPIPPTATTLPTATAVASPTATVEPKDYGPDNFPTNVDPLTGQVVGNPDLLNRRPIAVKINLYGRKTYRPPWGISFADIVYDFYHNDGYSRLHAIFYGKDAETVGAVRSGRLLDNDLVQMYKSIFVYGGADQRINRVFLNSNYSDRLMLEGGGPHVCPPTPETPMCRFEPNGLDLLLSGTREVTQYAKAKGFDSQKPDLNGMTFQQEAPANGKPGVQLFTRYSLDAYNRWDYDEASGQYLRFQDAQEDTGQGETFEPLTDRLNNQQVSAANVVVILAATENTLKATTAEIIDIHLSGSGQAYAFRDGQVYDVRWNRPTADSVLFLTDPDGNPFPFKQGTTWFQVIGQTSKVEDQGKGVWRFTFSEP